uniref:Uncharacterized protein n=1 Tax=Anguilla anguilla TaxID=7936 RepID=A0A0E9UA16_ANGAN
MKIDWQIESFAFQLSSCFTTTV